MNPQATRNADAKARQELLELALLAPLGVMAVAIIGFAFGMMFAW